MSSAGWQRWKNPWVIAGVLLGVVTLFGLALFVGNVARYVKAIRAGEPNPYAKDRMAAAAAQILSQPPLSPEQLAKLEDDPGAPRLGNPKANIRLVEFVDYECPFCRRSAPEVRAFMARHADDVHLTIRDYPIESVHDHALDAAIAARCVMAQGDAGRYWKYHDLLFQYQERLGVADLRSYAERVGNDLASYDECVRTRAPLAEIRAGYDLGGAVGVNGTPTFFLNGHRIPGAINLEQLEAMVAEMKKRI
ncbi:DsbA family protein [Candidatus Uhrbacteria bacterium]|nr:DsbA family protein [Candidatus Uhrbacteria bacterium]